MPPLCVLYVCSEVELQLKRHDVQDDGLAYSPRSCVKALYGYVPNDNRKLLTFCFFKGGLLGDQGFGNPIINQFVNFLNIFLTSGKEVIAFKETRVTKPPVHQDQMRIVQTSSLNLTKFCLCVEYDGDNRYRMKNNINMSSMADRTGSF